MTTYFISGHRKINSGEFIENYIDRINSAIREYPKAKFVVGDYYGVDTMAQELFRDLRDNGGLDLDLTVYHMLKEPRNNVGDWPVKGGFKNDIQRDATMTYESDEDIAWINPKYLGKRSGTEQNIDRRTLGPEYTCATCGVNGVYYDYCFICNR